MPVWSYSPQEVVTETLAVPTRVTEVSPGAMVAGQVTTNFIRSWRLRYTIVDTAQCTSMAAFFTGQGGPFQAFDYWSVGDQQTHRARFDSGMSIDLFDPGLLRFGEIVLVSLVGS